MGGRRVKLFSWAAQRPIGKSTAIARPIADEPAYSLLTLLTRDSLS